ncbi:MAG: PA0069 family radical SAM protein [Rhodospirillales bacterium]
MDRLETAGPIKGLVKGRGAVSNRSGRFERECVEAVDDRWDLDDSDLPPLRTQVTMETPKKIITRNTSPDIPYDRSINPYKGCEHGCVYCFARPSHTYMGLSAGLDFESRLFAKPNAAALLEAELSKPGYVPAPIQLGANTDPYQPVERDLKITRSILEVLARFNHPVSIISKSALIVRDMDILEPMAARGLAAVGISVTTLDGKLANKLEPRAPRPDIRLRAIRQLTRAGIPTIVMAAPMIPVLNDQELENILQAGVEHGAVAAAYILLRLPLEIKDIFAEWLETHAPDKAAHVLAQVRETRNGELNQSAFGTRMRGTGERAELLAQRFHLARKRLGLADARPSETALDTAQFQVPPKAGDQLALF